VIKMLAGVALVGATLVLAPIAHADRTVSAVQACSEVLPGSRPRQLTLPIELTCLDPAVVATPLGAETLPMAMARVCPGSYRVNPADRWSDWVIPG
jgi:hypothetical protein